jgi:hypothetical protein
MTTLLYLIACLMSPTPLINLAESRAELQWHYGYPFALGVTAMACVWLYRRFKKNSWL